MRVNAGSARNKRLAERRSREDRRRWQIGEGDGGWRELKGWRRMEKNGGGVVVVVCR